MLIWFIIAGVLGVVGIVRTPAILAALSPLPAATYFWHAGPPALVVIGGAFLAVTGGEAFYADMGHFGPIPIRIAWFGVALPALTLNYFGQGGPTPRRAKFPRSHRSYGGSRSRRGGCSRAIRPCKAN
jgi:KUP system potassium uptake protein